jgi:hypothetical protein
MTLPIFGVVSAGSNAGEKSTRLFFLASRLANEQGMRFAAVDACHDHSGDVLSVFYVMLRDKKILQHYIHIGLVAMVVEVMSLGIGAVQQWADFASAKIISGTVLYRALLDFQGMVGQRPEVTAPFFDTS